MTAPFVDDTLGPLSMTDSVVHGQMSLKDQAINELDALVVTRLSGNPRTLTTGRVRDWIARWVPVLGRSKVESIYVIVSKSPKTMDVATVRAVRK